MLLLLRHLLPLLVIRLDTVQVGRTVCPAHNLDRELARPRPYFTCPCPCPCLLWPSWPRMQHWPSCALVRWRYIHRTSMCGLPSCPNISFRVRTPLSCVREITLKSHCLPIFEPMTSKSPIIMVFSFGRLPPKDGCECRIKGLHVMDADSHDAAKLRMRRMRDEDV